MLVLRCDKCDQLIACTRGVSKMREHMESSTVSVNGRDYHLCHDCRKEIQESMVYFYEAFPEDRPRSLVKEEETQPEPETVGIVCEENV